VGGGVLGDVEVDNAPAVVSEHDENEEDAQARGGDREEVEGDQVLDVIGQERASDLVSCLSSGDVRPDRRFLPRPFDVLVKGP
jgi:hypothetical protein